MACSLVKTASTPLASAALALMLVAGLGAFALAGAVSTMVACVAILLCGLPHGTLDLAIIERERRPGGIGRGALWVLYLGLAALMFIVWSAAPVAALASFIVVSVVHFAEDWHETRSPFLAQGMAIAVLTAPTILHLSIVEQLFIALSATPDGALVASLMLLVAPATLAVAGVAIISLWQAGNRDQAIAAIIILAGMTFLPPVVGFAVFFCLFHSPRHLRNAIDRLGDAPASRRAIPLLTLAALGIAAVLFSVEGRPDLPARFVAMSFMTLSLLTVPHMLVPPIIGSLGADRIDRGASRRPSSWSSQTKG